MKHSVFLAIAVLYGFFALPYVLSGIAPPVLEGYDFNQDLSNLMANVTPATSDIPVYVYFKVYWRVDNTDIHMGIVCNGSAITGQNLNSYCGFGFKRSNDTPPGMLRSDAIAGTVDSNNELKIADLILLGQQWGDPTSCIGGGTNQICPDADRSAPCEDDIVPVHGERQGDYLIIEFSRKLNTGDTNCDAPIVPGVGIGVIFSIGLIDTTAVDPFPYSMLPHDFAANVLLDNYYMIFDRKPLGTNETMGDSTDDGNNTNNTMNSNQPTGTDQDSSASTHSFIFSLIGFSTLFAIRLL